MIAALPLLCPVCRREIVAVELKPNDCWEILCTGPGTGKPLLLRDNIDHAVTLNAKTKYAVENRWRRIFGNVS